MIEEANKKIRGVDEKIGLIAADAAGKSLWSFTFLNIGLFEPEAKRQKMLDWIWPPDFHHKQQDNRNNRHPNTGSAFLSNPKVLEWIEGPSNTLACVGGRKLNSCWARTTTDVEPAGVGKTLLV